jgi:ABC-type transport system involved in multi-copper enzyme maturation permease subunit
MIRFAWRQFRLQAIVVSGLLVAVAVVFLITGPHMVHFFDTTVKNCKAKGDCAFATNSLISQNNKIYQFMQSFSLVFPALLGIFWGAPLVARELETGTYRLAWSQGVTRSKWIVTKLATVGVASMFAAGLLSWMLTWWASPIDTINANRFSSLVFDTHYIAPIGYAAFAFAVGVTVGVLWRRTLPAMATTLAVYVAARLTFARQVRPHLLTPLKVTSKLLKTSGYGFEQTPNGLHFIVSTGSSPNALVFNSVMVGKHGARVTTQWLKANCANLLMRHPQVSGNSGVRVKGPPPKAFGECVDKIVANFHEVLTYQPASRFWTFQWYETGIYVVVSMALCAFSYWWLRRRFA